MLNIVTNGWFVDKIKNLATKVIKELPDLHINFGISVDGMENKHDFIRQKKKVVLKNAVRHLMF